MIALTQSVYDGDRWALVAVGQRFEFVAEWGPLLADMLCDQWPECESCEDRSCLRCNICLATGCHCTCEAEDADDEGEECSTTS